MKVIHDFADFIFLKSLRRFFRGQKSRKQRAAILRRFDELEAQAAADDAAQATAGNGMDVDSGPGDVEPAAPAFLAGAGNAAQRISSIIKLLVATRYNIFS